MKLVASMIVRNELGRYLDLAVEALLDYADEIRVLDDGSDDGTAERLDRIGNVRLLRRPTSGFYANEGRARQALLDWTLEGRPTWVLAIDADELVADPDALFDALDGSPPTGALTLSMEEIWAAEDECLCRRVDGHWRPHPVPALWRVPPRLDAAWTIPARKLASGRVPAAVGKIRARPTGTSILHLGWARESERRRRHERYAEHDRGRYHAGAHLASILLPDRQVEVEGRPWPDALAPLRPELLARIAS